MSTIILFNIQIILDIHNSLDAGNYVPSALFSGSRIYLAAQDYTNDGAASE